MSLTSLFLFVIVLDTEVLGKLAVTKVAYICYKMFTNTKLIDIYYPTNLIGFVECVG